MVQDNPKNIRRPLSVIKSVRMVKAWYAENDARPDGFVDIVGIEFNFYLTPAQAKAIADAVTFANKRILVYDKTYIVDGKNLLLQVTESGTPRTSVDAYDLVAVPLVAMDSITLYPQIIAAGDSLAPIALRGIYTPHFGEPSDPDILDVDFSEQVQPITANEPFDFFDKSENSGKSLTLTATNTTGSRVRFSVQKNPWCPVTGDSLWIRPPAHQSGSVTDLLGLTQSVKHKPAPLTVNPYPYDYELFVYPNPYEKSGKITSSLEQIFNTVIKPEQSENNILDGAMLIVALQRNNRNIPVPEISATISVYDALGNRILKKIEAKTNSNKSALYYLWNSNQKSGPNNNNGRTIGKGTYLLIFEINDAQKGASVRKKTIGIK